MARPRTFDQPSVLAAAMDRFWRHGYEATSVRDLASAMSITGASLYNAFGDKRSLFRRCLNTYLDAYARRRITELDVSDDPIVGIRVFFNDLVEASLGIAGVIFSSIRRWRLYHGVPSLPGLIELSLREIEDGFHRALGRLSAGVRDQRPRDARGDGTGDVVGCNRPAGAGAGGWRWRPAA